MRIASWAGVVLVVVVLFAGVTAADTQQQCQQSPLPANVGLPRDLARVLRRIYERSPRFRAQCER